MLAARRDELSRRRRIMTIIALLLDMMKTKINIKLNLKKDLVLDLLKVFFSKKKNQQPFLNISKT